MIVAIDGPAGSGKSTTARAVAERLGYLYLDTGAMYRAVALAVLRAHPDGLDAVEAVHLPAYRLDVVYVEGEQRVLLGEEDVSVAIRAPEVGAMASRVSTLPEVRTRLVAAQRRIARRQVEQGGGVVIDGRDIGTVVFPEADVKIFMVADAEERARRRYDELTAAGRPVVYADVLQDIVSRDRQDETRTLAPLRKADDAFELDTTRCSIEEQVRFTIARVRERLDTSAV